MGTIGGIRRHLAFRIFGTTVSMNAALLSLPLSVGSVCSTRDIGKENGRGNGMAAAALKVIKGDGGCRRLPNLTYPSWPACCLPAFPTLSAL